MCPSCQSKLPLTKRRTDSDPIFLSLPGVNGSINLLNPLCTLCNQWHWSLSLTFSGCTEDWANYHINTQRETSLQYFCPAGNFNQVGALELLSTNGFHLTKKPPDDLYALIHLKVSSLLVQRVLKKSYRTAVNTGRLTCRTFLSIIFMWMTKMEPFEKKKKNNPASISACPDPALLLLV